MAPRVRSDEESDTCAACDRCVTRWSACFDRCVKILEPLLVVLAVGLISLDALTFFQVVMPEITTRQGPLVAWGHALWSLWLLFNVLWNQLHCTFSSPGTTLEVHEQALQHAMTYDWRWCRRCNRGKPPLSHHCSICNRCVLKMDHHCVWMANCVGFFNYHYFMLFLWWMWVGSAYSALVYWLHVPWLLRLDDPNWERKGFLPFFMFVLSVSIWLGISALFGWHVWLVLTGQGTIEVLDNNARRAEAARAGRKWVNPYHLGAGANWRETFDAHGRWWWLTWMAPRRRRKLGNGYVLPTVELLSSGLRPDLEAQQPHVRPGHAAGAGYG
ncbi:hypothetical protein HYH03_017618 [Edaphochlamys debaryana]|uniref:S-acyltransferase n=1 Tax=Edaphochlamys debaryana TaxID=47281 RepID=A0A836BQE0_9CHLO|nr:hypothetical protein HYH03_017618 [Edaphochlamys debaryana]|eukprot:KAG2483508.1 hypothetical protein HYH03_017618 [Edaphochlamys debaryana]